MNPTPPWPRSVAERPLLIAHRGLPRQHVENSASALAAARRLGARAVELDVRPTSDGELAVLHDETTSRVTGHPGKVSETSARELREQRFGDAPDEGPILLDDAVAILCEGQDPPWIDIEVKDDPGASSGDLISRVANALDRSRRPDRVIVTSASARILEAAATILGEVARGLVYGEHDRRDALATAREVGAALIVANRCRVDESWIEHALHEEIEIWVYTVNDLDDARSLAARGFGIVTDDLPGLRDGWSIG